MRSGTSMSSSHLAGSDPELNKYIEAAPRWEAPTAARPGSHWTAPRATPSSAAAATERPAGAQRRPSRAIRHAA